MKEYSSEVIALRERVKAGNLKLNLAWQQICELDHNSQEWRDELERWHQANEKLSGLCRELKLRNYNDCLYLNKDGKKIKRCLGGLGCRVCPSSYPYWEQELMELPSPKK